MAITAPTFTTPSERDPALDGIRALAIGAVLLFHGGSRWFLGGHVGVDMFFVLSGFLITHSLLATRTSAGRLDLLSFWRRRALRLIPAATICIVVTSAAISLVASPVQRPPLRADAFSGIGYFANWRFLAEGRQYFRQNVDASPFLHLWSLSVEEQYYLVWPFVLAGVLLLARRHGTTTVRSTVLGLFAAATAWSVFMAVTADASRVFFGTDTHAYQLLMGASIAVLHLDRRPTADGPERSPGFGWSILVPVAAVVAISVVAPWNAYWRGVAATGSAGALVVALQLDRGSRCRQWLGARPLAALGLISYGVYLWHWPLVTIIDRIWIVGPGVRTALSAGGAITIAYFSWNVIEAPLSREGRRRLTGRGPASAIALSSAVLVVVGLSVAISAVSFDRVPVAPSAGLSGGDLLPGGTRTPVPSTKGRREAEPAPTSGACVNVDPAGDPADCRLTEGRHRVLLLGDSHAGDMVPVLALIAQRSDWALSAVVVAGCPWQPSLRYLEFDSPTCDTSHAATLGTWFDDLDPAVVIVVDHPLREVGFEVRAPDNRTDTDYDSMVQAETRAALALLQRNGASVVVLEPRPGATFDPQACLEVAFFLEQCAFTATDDALVEARWLRDMAAELSGVRAVQMIDLVCPRYPLCDPIVNDVMVRYDSNHLYPAFVQTLLHDLVERIEAPDATDTALGRSIS